MLRLYLSYKPAAQRLRIALLKVGAAAVDVLMQVYTDTRDVEAGVYKSYTSI